MDQRQVFAAGHDTSIRHQPPRNGERRPQRLGIIFDDGHRHVMLTDTPGIRFQFVGRILQQLRLRQRLVTSARHLVLATTEQLTRGGLGDESEALRHHQLALR